MASWREDHKDHFYSEIPLEPLQATHWTDSDVLTPYVFGKPADIYRNMEDSADRQL